MRRKVTEGKKASVPFLLLNPGVFDFAEIWKLRNDSQNCSLILIGDLFISLQLLVQMRPEIFFAIILKPSYTASPRIRSNPAFSACFSPWLPAARRISTYYRDKLIDTYVRLTYGRFGKSKSLSLETFIKQWF
jgi:hypothetical protein